MAIANSSKRLPVKWAVGLVVLLTAYTLLQPQLNNRLGWSLPSLADLQSEPHPERQAERSPEGLPLPAERPQVTERTNSTAPQRGDPLTADSSESPGERQPSQVDRESSPELRYGLLRQTGPDEFMSPQGLRYLPGSQEGHRLKHIARHLVDDPTRPGKHGVFDGDMPQVLRWLDEAYAQGRRGGRDVTVHRQDRRTVYEVRFPKPVGYVGGRDGGRQNHPDALHIRLVLEGDKVITAFPF